MFNYCTINFDQTIHYFEMKHLDLVRHVALQVRVFEMFSKFQEPIQMGYQFLGFYCTRLFVKWSCFLGLVFFKEKTNRSVQQGTHVYLYMCDVGRSLHSPQIAWIMDGVIGRLQFVRLQNRVSEHLICRGHPWNCAVTLPLHHLVQC